MNSMKEIAKTKLTASSVTTVPKAVRLFLGLDEGDKIVWHVEDGKVVVKKEGSGDIAKQVDNC